MLGEGSAAVEVHHLIIGEGSDETYLSATLGVLITTVGGELVEIVVAERDGEEKTVVKSRGTRVAGIVGVVQQFGNTRVANPYPAGLVGGELL